VAAASRKFWRSPP